MPEIFDVSLPLDNQTPIYPGDPEFKIEKVKDSSKDICTLFKISLGSHTGTHIDAPLHIFNNKMNIEEIPLDVLIGKSLLIEFTDTNAITVDSLKNIDLNDYSRILFKTKNSNALEQNKFIEDYTYLEADAAEYLVKKGIRLIGFDYYTIDKYNSDLPAHKILLGNNVIVIEGLNLSSTNPGEYEIIALPLRIKTDGAPARVILRKY